MKAGTKVIALRNVTQGQVFSFGEGVYLGDEVPPEDSPEGTMLHMLAGIGQANPKIQLEDGKIVWGCECWWGDAEETKEQYKNFNWNKVDIDDERTAQLAAVDDPDEELDWDEDLEEEEEDDDFDDDDYEEEEEEDLE